MTKPLSLRQTLYAVCFATHCFFFSLPLVAQEGDPVETPAGVSLDDFTVRETIAERPVLPYPPVRESDIMYEKRIWRVVDVREKMNQHFAAPESPLFDLIAQAALRGDIPVFSTEDDKFSKRISTDEVMQILYRIDTLAVYDMEKNEEKMQVVKTEYDWESFKRFRIKEAWFFDTRTGTMQSRILGIAPMIDVVDENGDFRYEKPVFWVHYPTIRPFLAQYKAILHYGNAASTITWEDIFEMRYFASAIYKENNVGDLRIQDRYAGVDMLLEGEKIDQALFNWEHDLWSW